MHQDEQRLDRPAVVVSGRRRRALQAIAEVLEPRRLLAVTNFYIDPVNGVDTNNGQTDRTAVRSLTRARTLVRGVNANMTDDIVVHLRGGTYALPGTFSLTNLDGGTNGHKVHWRAFQGETPIVSGGQNVTGWTTATVNGRTVWRATLSGSQFPDGLRDLYVNGERRERARSEAFQPIGMLRNAAGGATGLRVEVPGITSFAVAADLEIQQQVKWRHYVLPVTSVTPVSGAPGQLDLGASEVSQEWLSPDFVGFKSNHAVWLENAIELLDQPGEWYFDKTNSTVYYAPKAGETINQVTVTVPVLERLFQVTGTSTSMVSDLTVQGLTFEYGGWASPNRTGWFGYDPGHIIRGDGNQAGFSFANVYADYVDDTTFTGNTFRRMGGVGLHVRRATDLNVVGNLFTDTAAEGLGVGEVVDPAFAMTNVNVSNNLVYKAGHQYRMTSGILTGRAQGMTIHHNHVRDVSYIGINAYKVFGNKLTTWGGLSVRYNLIENTMGETFDGGAFYSWQPSSSNGVYSVFSDNYMRGIFSPDDSQGIYLDETPRYWLVERNVIEDAKNRWYYIKGGDLTFRDNFTTTSVTGQSNLLSPSNIVIERTTVDPSANWSAYPLAATTVANAGLQSAYAGLRTRIPAVPTANAAPVVNAGPDRSVSLNQRLKLDASVSDDRAPFDVLHWEWTKVSGPGTVSFYGQQKTVVDITAAFSQAGTYVLRLTANDMKATAFDDVTVTVTPAALGPNLALGLPSTAYTGSGGSGGQAPSAAFDNNTGTYWYGGVTGWLQVDLGAAKDISRVEIVLRNDEWTINKSEFEVVASNDPTFATHVTLGHQGVDAQRTPGGVWSLPVEGNGQTYRYVRYHKRHGFDAVVNELRVYERQIATTTPPAAPSGLIATPTSSTRVTLNWTDNANNESGFKVERKTGANGTYAQIATVGSNVGTYTDDAVADGVTYVYRVRATNAVGDSAYTAEASATPPAFPRRDPDNPVNVVAGLNRRRYTGTWDALPNLGTLTPTSTDVSSTFAIVTGTDNFGYTFGGYVDVPADATYTFYTTSDDGSRLYIGDTLVVDNDGLHSAQERSGQIGLKAGRHAILVTYFEKTGGEVLEVRWQSATIAKQLIPAARLFRDAPDATPPSVLNSTFDFQTGHRLVVRFSEDVSASLQAGDLLVRPVAADGTVAAVPASAVTYDAATHTATFTYTPALADGDYRATLAAGSVSDAAGNTLASSHALDFYVLAGDFNRDRVADFADLGILLNNYNAAGKLFSQGDANYDEAVDFADLGILLNNYNKSLVAPSAAASLLDPTPVSVLDQTLTGDAAKTKVPNKVMGRR